MLTRIQSNLTYANVIATLALFLALGGGAYAAFKLPKNSVGSKQIKAGAVNSSKVAEGSLLAGDFKSGQLPAGAQGPKGDPGVNGHDGTNGHDGAPGVARAYAYIKPDGTLDASRSSNVISSELGSNNTHIGDYCIKLGFIPKSVIATPRSAETGNTGGATTTATARYLPDSSFGNDCPADYSTAGGAQVILNDNGTAVSNAFFVLFN